MSASKITRNVHADFGPCTVVLVQLQGGYTLDLEAGAVEAGKRSAVQAASGKEPVQAAQRLCLPRADGCKTHGRVSDA